MFPLELGGSDPADYGMCAHPVAEALDVVEYLEGGPLAALEGAGVRTLEPDDSPSDSAAALPHGDDVEPIESLAPLSRIVLPSGSENADHRGLCGADAPRRASCGLSPSLRCYSSARW